MLEECNLQDDDPLWLKVLFKEEWKQVNRTMGEFC